MNRRLLKMNKSLQKVLMEYFVRKKKGSYQGFISVKEVSVANDMKSAKVFLSIMSEKDHSEEIYASLEQERYFIQRAVSRVLKLKFCPRLNFFVNHVPYVLNTEAKERIKLENIDTDNL